MRKNEIKGIIHDMLYISEWRNPLAYASLKNKVIINLIKGDVLGVEEDDIHKLYHEKIDWFKETIKKRGAKLTEFEEAKIILVGGKEKIEITFRGETFTGELVH